MYTILSSEEVVPMSACSLFGRGRQATAGQGRVGELVGDKQISQTLNLNKVQFFLSFVIYCCRNYPVATI